MTKESVSDAYTPINCTFHDRLEDYAIRGAVVPVVFIVDDVEFRAEAQIADVYAKDGADYARLHLTDGSVRIVRLDRLISVNGFELPVAC